MNFHFVIVFVALLFLSVSGEAFANEAEIGSEGGEVFATPVAPTTEDRSNKTPSDNSERERQKAINDMNAFLIESYKIKLDKLLSDVYKAVRTASKEDPALQVLLLKRVLTEINAKMDSIAGRDVSPNRKKILLSVFAYLQKDVEAKIESFQTK